LDDFIYGDELNLRTSILHNIVLALSLILTGTSAAQDRNRDIVKQVVEAWNQRFNAFQAIRFKAEGKTLFAKGSMTDDSPGSEPIFREGFPVQDEVKPVYVDLLFDLKSKRIRKDSQFEVVNVKKGGFFPQRWYFVYDNNKLKRLQIQEGLPSYSDSPLDKFDRLMLCKSPSDPYFLMRTSYPFLFALGRIVFYDQIVDANSIFTQALLPAKFTYYQQGKIGSRECTILRSIPEHGKSARFDEFWVDLARQGAILRWQAYNKGKAYINLNIDYQQIQGYWLPASWKLDHYSSQPGVHQLFFSETSKMTEIMIDPVLKKEDFEIQLKHGMLVTDPEKSNPKSNNLLASVGTYQVGSDDATLVLVGESTYVQPWWNYLLLLIIAGSFTGIIAYVKKRWWKKK